MAEHPPFVDVLEEHVRRSHRKPRQLSELTGLPLETIKNWLEGRVRRPREWRDIVKLARALHLSEPETSTMLQAAGHPPVAELAMRFPEQAALLAPLLAANHQAQANGNSREHRFDPTAERPPELAPLPPGSLMPLRHNPLFVGRDQELLRIGAVLCAAPASALGTRAAVSGPGGIGKTQTAVEFVHRFGQFFPGGVFWISFADRDAVANQIAACGGAGAMELAPNFADLSLDDQVRAVCAAWRYPVARLLVFDNCEERELLRTWLPVTGGCRVLVTSRKATWDAELGVDTLALDVLPREQSRALLLSHRGDLDGDAATLDAIAAELGDLPLALHLAGSYLARYRRVVTAAAYLEELQRAPPPAHPPPDGAGSIAAAHLHHVARTFGLSFERLDPTDPVDALARALLRRAAWYAPGEPIPRAALLRSVRGFDARTARRQHMAEDAILRLTDVGLAGEQNDGALRLHRLVGASVRTLLPDTGARHEVEQTLTQLAVEIGDAGDIRYARQLQPHLHLAAERALAGAGEHAADLAHGLGYVLWLFARYSQAQHYLERALELRADRDPLGVAGSYNLLALTYQVQSRFELARSMFEQAIELWTAHLAPGDERLVDEQHNLGYLYVVMGNYDAAASLLRRALYARRERYGLASLQVIRSLNGLGYLYILHNEYRSAKHYLRLARALGEQALPEHHSAHALTLMFLGRVLYFEQQPAAALNLLHRAAHIYYGLYGFESGAIAESYGYIGRIMGEQGDGDAWRYLEQALAIAERVMGDPNRDTAIVLMQCGSVARYQGQPARARAFFERAHGMLQQIHGASHPDLVTVERELAELARGA